MISAEKKIQKEKLVEIIEAAIRTAYKKDYGNKDEKVNVKLNLTEGTIDISVEKTVVQEVTDPTMEISLEELWDDAGSFSLWDIIEIDVTDEVMSPEKMEVFGRIASQAARQVIIQKIGDTEKEKIYDLFVGKEGQAINMKVELVEWGKIVFDYNGNQVVLPKSEQVSKDEYRAGQRYYLYVAEVSQNEGGNPKVILSRKRPEIVPAIFAQFVPEVADGIVIIERVVRFPGVKTKMLVSSNYEEIDPVGTLIGQKWMRVKSVMEEISGEKVDIIPLGGDIREVITRALTPAQVEKVEIEGDDLAKVYIRKEERAKAVGKSWVNVNLASELTGYKISLIEVETPLIEVVETEGVIEEIPEKE
jgi:transcription termination/antitermination protein NusA